ncbi:hypothetical protein MXD61_10485 [Frankia sp. AgPm24]|uniref:hypothetical protein n=1 Tax=Frankia sp. AgPm24 TaxID=631128 RepID=UPI00200FDB23|nr:hypothetical protein [Frankia sp. AgPm24]MCK9922297.1 hypothetical protein [Frankia sp. AgPm24]
MDPYQWWQDRLTVEFFGPSAAGRPVVLYVDNDKAKALRGPDGPDLVEAVQSRLDWYHQNDIFDGIFRTVPPWRRGTRAQPPPCLPLLAVCVLAGTLMRREGRVWSSNYYQRLVECLPMPRGTDQESLQRLQTSYEQIPAHWEILGEWMREQDGARGIVTFPDDGRRKGNQSRIVFALSQAIVRERDLPELERFFRSPLGRSAVTAAEPVELVSALRRWEGLDTRRLSPPLQEALLTARSDQDRILGGILVAVAGSSHRPAALVQIPGQAAAQGRLTLVLQPKFVDADWGNWEAGWHAPIVDGVDGDALTGAGWNLTVRAEPGLTSYTLTGDPPAVETALVQGMTATGTRLRVAQGPRNLLVAAEDDAAGAWVAGDAVDTDEPLLFVVRDDRLGPVVDAVSAAVGDVDPEPGPFPGWHVLRDVLFTDAVAATAVFDRLGIGVAVRSAPPLRLVGGLRIGRDSGEGARGSRYLLDGPPDVALPAGFDTATAVLLNGRRLRPPRIGRVIRLRSLGLAEGTYTVRAGEFTRRFTLHPPRRPTTVGGIEELPAGSGRSLPVPHGAKVYFFRADGHATPVGEPTAPRWWKRRGTTLQTFSYRVIPPRDAVWLAATGPSTIVHQLRDDSPKIDRLTAADTQAWAHFVLASQAGQPHEKAWRRYQKAVLNHQSVLTHEAGWKTR